MHKNIVFSLFDFRTEEMYRQTTEQWTPLTCLCLNTDLPIAHIYFFYWPQERASLKKHIAYLRSLNQTIQFSMRRIPATGIADILSSSENSERMTRFFFELLLRFRFDYESNKYFYYFQGIQSYFNALMFYVVTRRMLKITSLGIECPSEKVSWPGRLIYSTVDMRVYANFAKMIQASRYDSSSFLKAGIRTQNVKFNAIIEKIEFVAIHSRDRMLILGPTGAGKSALVKRIYELKKMRKNLSGAFIEVNCATIRGAFSQSQLFGHVRGSYTGADGHREGLLKAAHNGLLFLDEIGSLGLEEQALLLKAIEEKRFLPLGSDKEVNSDFQLVCGTNQNLAKEVQKGHFRADLFARINLWTFTLPGLAERPEDIEPNLDYELHSHQERTGDHIVYSPSARQRFLDFATAPDTQWLGNFRDFTAAVHRMILFADTGVIYEQQVDDEIYRLRQLWQELEQFQSASTESTGGFVLNALANIPKHGASHEQLSCLLQSLVEFSSSFCSQGSNSGKDSAFRLCRTVLSAQSYEDTDPFDLAQLEEVLRVCQLSLRLPDAGRVLFSSSRKQRSSVNDSDRLRKFLTKHGLDWHGVKNILG